MMTTSPDDTLPTYDHHRGAGPTLVLLHYWGGSVRTWEPLLDRLRGLLPAAPDVLAVDARGWGRSRGLPGPFGLHRLADDTRAVLAEAGVQDHVLVGHSMGGKVAQLVAADRPVGLRGVVLVAPAPARPAPGVTAEYREGLSHAYDSDESVGAAVEQVLTASPLSETARARVVEDSRASAERARAEWPLHGIAEDVSDRTRQIAAPTLVVAGELDRVEPPAVLRSHLLPYLADARLEVLPGSGHLVPLEAPEALAAAVATFLGEVARAS